MSTPAHRTLVLAVSRIGLPTVVGRAMPGAVALVFGVSQLSAIVDFARLSRELRDLATAPRFALWFALVVVGALSGASSLRPVLYGRRLQFFWPLPIPSRVAFLALLPLALGASCVGVSPALLLGPAAALSAWIAAASAALLVTSRRWGLGAVTFPRIHRRSVGWAGTPVGALVQRDALALVRTAFRSTALTAIALFLLSLGVQTALQTSWSPSQIGAGARITLGFAGPVCGAVVAAQAQVLGSAYTARGLPVSPPQRVLAICLSASSPLAVVLVAQGIAGPGGALSLGLALIHAAAITTVAAARVTGADRENATGLVLFASVFLTLLSVARPMAGLLVEALVIAGSLALAAHRVGGR